MAYMSQDHKARIAAVIKPILKKYKVKGSLSVRHHSTLVLNIKSGPIDFIGNYNEVGSKQNHRNFGHGWQDVKGNIDVNPYWYKEHFTGEALEFLGEIIPAMYGPEYFDESDIQTDYFHCSHYIDVNVGKWDKDYELTV